MTIDEFLKRNPRPEPRKARLTSYGYALDKVKVYGNTKLFAKVMGHLGELSGRSESGANVFVFNP